MITHYELAGLPQYATCSPGPCDMINGTNTTLTGIQCNTSYMVSVRAVSVNFTTLSDPIEIFFHPTTSCSACGTYIKNVATAKLMPSKYIVLMFIQILPIDVQYTTINYITYYFYIRLSECLIVHRCACTTGNRSISGYSCHIPTNSHHLLTAHTTHHLQVPVPAQKKEWQVETSCCCLWSCVII